MIIADYNARQRQSYKTEIMMAVAREHIRAGKKVFFAYNSLVDGLELLRHHFPNALYEVCDIGFVVWERKVK